MEDYSGTTNSDEREILSVTELNKTVNDFINEAFPPLWVVGEISNFKEYGSSGHWYFSVKDTESVLNCSMFRLQNISLGFKPNEGDQVIMQRLAVNHENALIPCLDLREVPLSHDCFAAVSRQCLKYHIQIGVVLAHSEY